MYVLVDSHISKPSWGVFELAAGLFWMASAVGLYLASRRIARGATKARDRLVGPKYSSWRFIAERPKLAAVVATMFFSLGAFVIILIAVQWIRWYLNH
ncbi:hypothetical protein Cme02nite_51410 [Catellatospora methionotrophica]|uniref:Uncharacterized protein n=1 Tax=Catellatospora methionotrophica TaxID=121620 RepID=A0A8J3LJH3_9ACTN|nr:hypothetical protein [Catellatospora methionotrophica]GIG16809.1 hypothetical protein Cme02nite_51410 [Catellatospora methionotrophica]